MTAPRADTAVLERFLEQVVVDEYADVPSRAHGSRHRPWLAIPALAAIGLIISVAVITTNASDEQRQGTRAALVERVTALSESVTAQQQTVDASAARVESLRAQVLDPNTAQADQLDALAEQAGATAIDAAGLTITVDDQPGATAGSLNRVLDRDLQDIVNALWRGGAQAIAINGQRLTSLTAVRGAGDAILVNYQPLNRPYRVTATGSALDTSGVRGLLTTLSRDYGLVTELATGDVALPAGEVRTPRFAEPATGGSTQ